MVDNRVVRVYPTRENLSVDEFNAASSEECLLVALTLQQVYILTRVIPYAKRRINWIDTVINQVSYTLPDDVTLLGIRETVEEMEAMLVEGCVSALVDAIEAIGTKLEALSSCVCSMSSISETRLPPSLPAAAAPYTPSLGTEITVGATLPPGTDSAKCDLANVIHGIAYDIISERFLPLAQDSGDAVALVITLTAGFAFATAGIGLPAAVVAAAFTAVVAYLLDMAASNLLNWMVGNGQEIICTLYSGLVVDDYKGAGDSMQAMIEASGLPFGDRMMLTTFYTTEWLFQAIEYQIKAGKIDPADYLNYSCAGCDVPADPVKLYGSPCPTGDFTRTGEECRNGYSLVDGGQYLIGTRPLTMPSGDVEMRVRARDSAIALPAYQIRVHMKLVGEETWITTIPLFDFTKDGEFTVDKQALAWVTEGEQYDFRMIVHGNGQFEVDYLEIGNEST